MHQCDGGCYDYDQETQTYGYDQKCGVRCQRKNGFTRIDRECIHECDNVIRDECKINAKHTVIKRCRAGLLRSLTGPKSYSDRIAAWATFTKCETQCPFAKGHYRDNDNDKTDECIEKCKQQAGNISIDYSGMETCMKKSTRLAASECFREAEEERWECKAECSTRNWVWCLSCVPALGLAPDISPCTFRSGPFPDHTNFRTWTTSPPSRPRLLAEKFGIENS